MTLLSICKTLYKVSFLIPLISFAICEPTSFPIIFGSFPPKNTARSLFMWMVMQYAFARYISAFVPRTISRTPSGKVSAMSPTLLRTSEVSARNRRIVRCWSASGKWFSP